MTNSSIVGADPLDQKTWYRMPDIQALSNDYRIVYAGQTNVIRFSLTLDEPKSYYLALKIESSLKNDEIDLVKLYLSNVGDNYPCVSQMNSVSVQKQ